MKPAHPAKSRRTCQELIRHLRQPSPKLEVCLKKRNFRVVIFTENLRDAKLQLEELEISELSAAKLKQCTSSFIAEIFR